METEEAKKLIGEAKNIYLILDENPEPEAIASTLALFYTLKELGKNVNLIAEDIPENLKFLTPSLDFISYPKNFVLAIPNNIANISQIYYEKNNDALKIHLTLEKGSIKKDDISFYFSETKPDLIITLGIKDYQDQLKNKLNSFGFLLDSPILNIDNGTDNKNFGKINLIEDKSLAEVILSLTENINKKTADCLLTGLILHTDNFKKNITADVFEAAGSLMKNGADLKTIMDNIK
jgi:nanoRNase/pAp phosphatase (c-di-AMP/oligoRNAs hydrolase)